jgi:hypothetical protein
VIRRGAETLEHGEFILREPKMKDFAVRASSEKVNITFRATACQLPIDGDRSGTRAAAGERHAKRMRLGPAPVFPLPMDQFSVSAPPEQSDAPFCRRDRNRAKEGLVHRSPSGRPPSCIRLQPDRPFVHTNFLWLISRIPLAVMPPITRASTLGDYPVTDLRV